MLVSGVKLNYKLYHAFLISIMRSALLVNLNGNPESLQLTVADPNDLYNAYGDTA